MIEDFARLLDSDADALAREALALAMLCAVIVAGLCLPALV